MPSAPFAQAVLVSIVSATVQTNPAGWQIEYEVKNTGPAAIWLAVDESLVFRQTDDRIVLSYARAKMLPGVTVSDYVDPKVVEIRPGQSVRQSVQIAWPLRLNDIWNPERRVLPAPGEYEVSLRVGVAAMPKPKPPRSGEGVEARVLRWQREAASPPFRMRITPIADAPDAGAHRKQGNRNPFFHSPPRGR